jgi:hypothetical protein
MATLALIPYYGGPAGEGAAVGNTPENKRVQYLRRTVNSLKGFADKVVIGATGTDWADGFDHPCVRWLTLDCAPMFIPANLCRAAQDSDAVRAYDHVYVTEADQVLTAAPRILDLVDGDNYLVPHRLEEVYLGRGADRGLVVYHNGKWFAICNGAPVGDGTYHPSNIVMGYGGAFLSTWELFKRIPFPDSTVQPVEHVTGFSAYTTGHALKTSRWDWFSVEHLSGLDFHKSL